MTEVERKFVLVRVSAGDYLLVSNDERTLWRISSYTEDGSLGLYDDNHVKLKTVTGTFWAAHWRPLPAGDITDWLDEDFFEWSEWREWCHLQPTRRDAVNEALSSDPKR